LTSRSGGYEDSSSESSTDGKHKVSELMSTLDKSTEIRNKSEPSSLAQKIQEAKQQKQRKQYQQPAMTSTKNLSSPDKSFGQVLIDTGYTVQHNRSNNTLSQNTVTFREPESTLIDSGLNLSKISNLVTTETIQKLVTSYSLEKNDITKLIEDNKNLEKTVQELQAKLLVFYICTL